MFLIPQFTNESNCIQFEVNNNVVIVLVFTFLMQLAIATVQGLHISALPVLCPCHENTLKDEPRSLYKSPFSLLHYLKFICGITPTGEKSGFNTSVFPSDNW